MDKLENNNVEMTKKDEGKKQSTPQKLKRTKGSEEVRKFYAICDHFTRNNCEKNLHAPCNYCGQSYASDFRKSGTSNLWSHLQSKCRKSSNRIIDKKQKTISFDTKKEVGDCDGPKIGNLKVVKYDPESIKQVLTSMIICDELPFKVVKEDRFKNYSRLLEPRFVIPSRITVWRD